jgi:UDP-sugar transporter A1/2/3
MDSSNDCTFQICCSVFAGVYNEYLIKNIAGNEVHIMVQNVFMYVDSIVCNLAVLTMRGDLSTAFSAVSMSSIMQGFVIAIILNNAIVGIVTSLFLKVCQSFFGFFFFP